MNELKVFSNQEFGQVRTIIKDNNEIWFIAKDVTDKLEYQNGSRDVERHVEKEDIQILKINDGTQYRNVQAINESGLYSLILGSKQPNAKEFKHWVTSDVLPSIRQTGGYVNNDDLFINTYLPNADEQTKLMFKSQLTVIKNLNSKIEQDKGKVLFADAVTTSNTEILVGDLAKLLKQNGIEMGVIRLFKWLRDNKYLISRQGTDYNMPTQKSMELGLFRVKETTVTHPDGHTSVNKTPKVTGKGQQYFINKFLGGRNERKTV